MTNIAVIDEVATAWMLRRGKLEGAESRMLRAFLCGSIPVMERPHKHGIPIAHGLDKPQSPICIFCKDNKEETVHHFLWECEGWQGIRKRFKDGNNALYMDLMAEDWPDYIRGFGILLEGPDLLEWGNIFRSTLR